MSTYKNNPTSPTKRPGIPLNVDTGYNGKRKENSPPRTPVAQSARAGRSNNTTTANRVLKGRNGQRETFLDDITPVDGGPSNNESAAQREYQDAHGLALSPRQVTRDSLVDNMLLSLDQFSFGQDERQPTVEEERLYAAFGQDESYQTSQNFAPKNPRGIGHNYSYSSDYEGADDASRYSGQMTRGRRSNSSSNFQSGLGRINSVRNDTGSNPPISGAAMSSNGAVQLPSRGVHSRSGKGSKGSSATSLDLGYAQNNGSQRWGHATAGRSSSFDFGSDRQSLGAQVMARPMNSSTAAFNSFDYDAAPTPTIPGGPRRVRPASPIIIPQQEPPPIDPPIQRLERKRSSKSSKSAYKGKNAAVSTLDYGLHDITRELPPLPAFMKEAAPGPLVGYGKSKDLPPVLQPKERQGFFRRVFGSSRSHPTTPPEVPRSHGSTTSTETNDRPNSKPHHIASQIKPQHLPPPREPPLPPKEHNHVLTKKPSSFFRRRKKSVSEVDIATPVPAIPPIRLQREITDPGPEPSPVSSLRKVMNPYIRTPQRSPIDVFQHDTIDRHLDDSPERNKRTARGFSLDYEPDKNATIRTVGPSSRDAVESLPSSYSTDSKPFLTTGASNNDRHSKDDEEHSFLQDSSDNDRSTSSKSAVATADAPDSKWLGTLKPNSPSVARDIALVAEYERIHSKRSPTSSKFEVAKSSPANSTTRSPQEPTKLKKNLGSSKEDEWVMLTPTKTPAQVEVESRVWLEPSSSEEDVMSTKLPLPLKAANISERTSGSTETVYKSATSLPILQIEGEDTIDDEVPPAKATIKEADKMGQKSDETTLADGDRERAQLIFDGNEDFIQKEKAAAWMGDEGPARARTLVAYMELYDFANMNILAALRVMCGRLVLKGESQQVDRILDQFAQRWCRCNPGHGFKVTDVVHTICYSLLLLNTDLHLADIDQKMTRSQFVKNTMPTIRRSVTDSAPDAFEPNRPSVLPGKGQPFESANPRDNTLKTERQSVETERPSWRSSFKPPARQDSGGIAPTPLDYDTPVDDCGPLVKAPFHGTLRTWEVQVEIVLKDFYNSIRTDRLPLFGAPLEKPQPAVSSNTLSVFTNGMLRRSPSVLSKTPSESQTYARGRTAESARAGNGKWGTKNRSRPRLYPNSGLGSSRTSLDDQSSMWSPSVSSSTWSKYSLGKTHTSMSVDSLSSNFPQGDYQQSIGFANALSQAIIREEHIGSAGSGGSDREELRVAPLLDDESLELAGAPWAKEGILKHKHHLEALDKKAKDRNWNEVFAVIEKGYMSLFSFSTKSMRNKSKGKASGGVVGGGNWQENAESLGSFLLRQTIASALPSPGYSKARPHVWALSLPTGAVHLFQVGTPEIVKEFVSTANYWSARLSNHPLVGGISNIEYGWSENIVNNALVAAINDSTGHRASSSGHRPSLQSSLRSSLDQGMSAGIKARLPGDKIMISDWTPPTQSMRASNLMEPDQLTTLVAYVSGIEDELQRHNQLRSPMLLAFTPRHANSIKAMANWEKKSSYLLREIVKFRTYIDCLQAAEIGKQKIYAEREAHKAALATENSDSDDEGDVTLRP